MHIAHVPACRTQQNLLQQALAQSLTTSGGTDRHLPDKQRIRALGQTITRHKGHHLAFLLCQQTGFSEMRALQQIAVQGIGIQRFAAIDQLVHR